ncbi:MAG: phosphoribosyl-AMP cyclohydrolase [Bacillota bacterium]|nr:phosphoribosyl-AMP cyclohydrolase [Bacillota bacterium]
MTFDELAKSVDFSKGLIPAVVQDNETNEVLMLAYMNEESLKKTIETKTTWFWSRSRQEYWNKGATSGHFQYVKSIAVDCDGDTLVIKVEQVGAACHTGNRTCFYRTVEV